MIPWQERAEALWAERYRRMRVRHYIVDAAIKRIALEIDLWETFEAEQRSFPVSKRLPSMAEQDEDGFAY